MTPAATNAPQPASIARTLTKLASPILGVNLLNVLMLAVDSALCGRLPDHDVVLAALGLSVQLMFLLMVAMLGLLVGTVSLVARAFGAGDAARIDHVVRQSTMLCAGVGVIAGVPGALFAEQILQVMGGTPEVAAVGADYLRPLMLGTPAYYLSLLYTGILRGVGNTRIPFYCALLANVINAILNYALVLGNLGAPSLGVVGSAIGTVIAQAINLVILIYVLRRGRVPGLRPRLAPAPLDRGLARELFRIGWPAAIDAFILNAGFLFVLRMLGEIDQNAVAAHGLGLRIQSLAYVPGYSISQAAAALTGQALGAGDIARARSVGRASVLLCLVIMSLLATLFVIAATPLVAIFDVGPSSPLYDYSIEWIRIFAVCLVPSAVFVGLSGLLQGAGATRLSLGINLVTTLLMQIPIAYLFGFVLDAGATGVWWSFAVGFVAKAALIWFVFKRETWAVTGVRVPPR